MRSAGGVRHAGPHRPRAERGGRDWPTGHPGALTALALGVRGAAAGGGAKADPLGLPPRWPPVSQLPRGWVGCVPFSAGWRELSGA